MIKLLLLIASALPLCLHSPYLLQAWNSSRLDKWDWIFYILAIPAVISAVRISKPGKSDYYALLLLLPMLFLTATPSLHHINALSIASAVGVIFATAWLLYSWQLACRVLPAAVIVLLGTPSSSYQLSLLMMCPVYAAWAAKFLLAVLCGFSIYCFRRWNCTISRGTLFFSAAVLGSALLLLHTGELYFEGRSFIPEFSTQAGDFWGRRLEVAPNTKRFFATSKVEQFRYTTNNVDISVLSVLCGKDIHEIHPASHCLRTSLWTINSENILYLQNDFAVTEIDAQKGHTRLLVWVYYSSDKLSTPSFLGFRRHYHPGIRHYTYQISTPVYNSLEQSRSQLRKFIQALRGGK